MRDNMKILAIIPARGGSKGVPRKNIKNLYGKPLIAWTIECAKNSKYLTKIIVSTDDEEIAKISEVCGAEVPFLRPLQFAKDNSPTIDSILHAIEFFEEKGEFFDIIVLLQPTSPLKITLDVDKSINQLINNHEAKSLGSVDEPNHPPYWSMSIKNDFLVPAFGQELFEKRRQDLPKTYMPNGAIFIAYTDELKKYKTFYTPKTTYYTMTSDRSIDIDTEFDFELAEFYMGRRENGDKNRK